MTPRDQRAIIAREWPCIGDYVLCDDGLLMKVVWVAPKPLDVFLCEPVHRRDGNKRRAFRPGTRGKEWFPSDAKGQRKGLGDPTKRGKERFDSMHPWEQEELKRNVKDLLPLLAWLERGFVCISARQLLWLAVAEAAQRGWVICPEAPTLQKALFEVARVCARAEHTLDDDLRASMALSAAELAVKPARWKKDGLARGIKAHARLLTVMVPGIGCATFTSRMGVWLCTRTRLK